MRLQLPRWFANTEEVAPATIAAQVAGGVQAAPRTRVCLVSDPPAHRKETTCEPAGITWNRLPGDWLGNCLRPKGAAAPVPTKLIAVVFGVLTRWVALARASLPEAADYERIEHRWAGLRPATPASSPVIRLAGDGLVLNIGHGMLGWTLAMGSGERAARRLLDA